MGFFKDAGKDGSSQAIARLQQLIWVLIYAGLLGLVLGLAVQRSDDELGWTMVLVGGALAGIGIALIYFRSLLSRPD